MAFKKVWHEELQDWVYEDPERQTDDIPSDNIDNIIYNKTDIPGCNPLRGSVPLSMLEERFNNVRSNKS